MLDALEDHELPEFRSEEWLWQALVLAVRDNARARGTSRAVVALEGDLPSSLLAALAVDALGPAQCGRPGAGTQPHLYAGAGGGRGCSLCRRSRHCRAPAHSHRRARCTGCGARARSRRVGGRCRAPALSHAGPHVGGHGARAGRDGSEPAFQDRVRVGGTGALRWLPGRLRALWRCVSVDPRVCGARAQPHVCRGAAGARDAQRGGGLYGARAGASALDA